MSTLTIAQAVSYLNGAGFPQSSWQTMVAIGFAESGLDTEQVNHDKNGTVDLGWLQINRPAIDQTLFNPSANADAAYALYKERGYEPWSTFNSGKYQQYMNRAASASTFKPVKGTSPLGSAIDSTPLGAVGSALSDTANLAEQATKLLGSITQAAFWRRIGIGVVGVVLVTVAIAFLIGDEVFGQKVPPVASKSTRKGAATKGVESGSAAGGSAAAEVAEAGIA